MKVSFGDKYGEVVGTISNEVFDIEAAGSKRLVPSFVVLLPDYRFTVVPIAECKQIEEKDEEDDGGRASYLFNPETHGQNEYAVAYFYRNSDMTEEVKMVDGINAVLPSLRVLHKCKVRCRSVWHKWDSNGFRKGFSVTYRFEVDEDTAARNTKHHYTADNGLTFIVPDEDLHWHLTHGDSCVKTTFASTFVETDYISREPFVYVKESQGGFDSLLVSDETDKQRYFREHRGGFAESMKTMRKVDGVKDIQNYLNSVHPDGYLQNIRIDADTKRDHRLNLDEWGKDTYMVVADFEGYTGQCVGFANFCSEDENPTVKMDAKEPEDNQEVIDIYAFNRVDLTKKMRQDGVDFCGLAFKAGTGLHRFRVDHKTFKCEAESYQDNEHGVCFRQRLSFKCRYLQNICGASDEIGMPEELRMDLGFIWKVSDGYQILYNPNERVRCWEEKGLFKAETFNKHTLNYVQLTDEVVEAMKESRGTGT